MARFGGMLVTETAMGTIPHWDLNKIHFPVALRRKAIPTGDGEMFKLICNDHGVPFPEVSEGFLVFAGPGGGRVVSPFRAKFASDVEKR